MERIVKYDFAKLLYKKGFNEPCNNFYSLDGYLRRYSDSNEELDQLLIDVTAPTYQQAIDWLDSKNIIIQPHLISQFQWDDGWGFELTYINSDVKLVNTDEDRACKDRYEALDQAFEKAIKLL